MQNSPYRFQNSSSEEESEMLESNKVINLNFRKQAFFDVISSDPNISDTHHKTEGNTQHDFAP